ncbi:MAG: DUF192 domain-containing protein [Brevundimonas sp.]|uniref:DUF192 domain-containing protein n=1 Tax=Brevundimonas albigilva TaxID=1312364 RepID=A0ABY4SSX3_9CAUL|nr:MULTISPECIES: DUF192 domain-containing protein [Brevundimonas]PZU56347.1 MAG: DUF192 domain-containing protein [Brevundimonas sp.]UQV18440.1 DUF192 domain-containing protein [Brevundimonas albigilva]URI16747.1 DUF192 domain-containing protein [Brevundimonas albigilva]
MPGWTRRVTTAGLLALTLGMSGLTACAGSAAPQGPNGEPMQRLSIVTATGEHDFWVEIADEEPERQRGLMFRPPLEPDRGMLFTWPGEAAREQSFWMRNTPSSLDILYIDPSGRIVSIAPHTTPESEAPIPSNGVANGVLELRAGRADEIGAKPGDQVRHPYFKP